MNTETNNELEYLRKIHQLDCELVKLLTSANEMALQTIAKLEADLQSLRESSRSQA